MPPDVLYVDLLRMWRRRTWLLILGALTQGAQYVARPDRPYLSEQYQLLRPLGLSGWRIAGVVLIALALHVAVAEYQRIPTSTWFRALAFAGLGTYYGLLFAAAALNHFYIASTLILPVGLALSELDQLNLIFWRRRRQSSATPGRS